MSDDQVTPVRIVDVNIPFWSMVKLIMKWTIASIPTMLLLMVVALLIGGAITAITSGLLLRGMSGDTPAESSELTSDTGDPAALATSALSATEWSLTESAGPNGETPTVTLAIASSTPEGTASLEAPALILRCSGSETDLFIDWQVYLGADETNVTTRLDGGAASEQAWPHSTDNEASFFPESPVSFITQLVGAETLVAETEPFGEQPITATFALSGLADRIYALRNACGW
jgi:type VI secretion system protein VasI